MEKEPKVSRESSLPYPPPVVDYLKRFKKPSAEAVEFLNLLLHRIFLTFRSSDKFRQLWGDKMSLNINRKLKNNSYVDSVKITDVILGDFPPMFKSCKPTILDDLTLVNSKLIRLFQWK